MIQRPVPIEDTIRPESPIELALLNRIEQLKRMAYTQNLYDPFSTDPNDLTISTTPAAPTLRMAALVETEANPLRGIKVTARTFGNSKEGRLGFANYVSRDLLEMTEVSAARMLGELHKKAMNDLATHLTRKRIGDAV